SLAPKTFLYQSIAWAAPSTTNDAVTDCRPSGMYRFAFAMMWSLPRSFGAAGKKRSVHALSRGSCVEAALRRARSTPLRALLQIHVDVRLGTSGNGHFPDRPAENLVIDLQIVRSGRN